MTNVIAGFLLGFGVARLVDYLMDKHKADKEKADFMQAEIDALRSAIMGDVDYLMDKHKADKEKADFMQAEIDALRSAIMGDTEEDRED